MTAEPVVDEGREFWRAHNVARILVPVRDVPGRWYLHMSWQCATEPVSGDGVLRVSSIGLNVDGPLTAGLSTQNVVRYDVDRRASERTDQFGASHVNVLQPVPLQDHVHYAVFHDESHEWPVEEVLGFLVSDVLHDDLRKRMAT